MNRAIIILITSLLCMQCQCQEGWKAYNKDNGLAGNHVKKYLVRHSGEIWLLTGSTINIFNGKEWKHIDHITDSVSNEEILFEDIMYMNEGPKKHVWLGCKKGLYEYNNTNWKFHKERWNKKFGYQAFGIRYFSMDAQGYIWAFLEKIELFPTDFNRKWTIGSLFRFNGEEWEFHTAKAGGRYAQFALDKQKYYKKFLTDSYGNFWIITYDGFRIWDGENWEVHNGLRESEFDWIVQDKKGNTWMANQYGLLCYDGKEWIRFKKKNGLSSDWVYFMSADNNNRLWALCKSKNYNVFRGLDCYEDGKWVNYDAKKEGFLLPIISVNHPGDDNLWLGCENGISVFDGTCWKNYTHKDGLSKTKYRWIERDNKGNIWASDNKIMLKLDGEKWIRFFEEESKDELWFINKKYIDKKGNLWIGVNANGLYRFDGDEIKHFTEDNGLADKQVLNIFEDHEGNIWFLTTMGASVFHY